MKYFFYAFRFNFGCYQFGYYREASRSFWRGGEGKVPQAGGLRIPAEAMFPFDEGIQLYNSYHQYQYLQ
jgi:hypothetical protein